MRCTYDLIFLQHARMLVVSLV